MFLFKMGLSRLIIKLSLISSTNLLFQFTNGIYYFRLPTFYKGNNKFVLEIKESLLIKRDRPILNKNISSAKLFLFDNS